MNSWKAFLPRAGCGSVLPAKSCWDAWRSGSQLARSQVNMADKAKLYSPIHSTFFFLVQLLKCQLCNVLSGIVVENNSWAQSIHQCWLQALQFLVHFINLLSILLRCNGFAGIQTAIVDHMGSRLPNSDHDLFWYKFDFGKCSGASQSNHWSGHCWLLYKIHFSSHITIRLRNGSLLLSRIVKWSRSVVSGSLRPHGL